MDNAQTIIRYIGMMYFYVIIWIVNLINIYIQMVVPCYHAFKWSQLFKSQDRKLEFLPNYGMKPKLNTSPEYIMCRLWVDDDHYYEWKMTEDGEMLSHLATDEKTWITRQRVGFHARAKYNSSPWKHPLKRSHGMYGIMGWTIKHHIPEEFIVAKLGGFMAPYDIFKDLA